MIKKALIFFIAHLYLGWVFFFGSPFLLLYLSDHFISVLAYPILLIWYIGWFPWSIPLMSAFIDLKAALWLSCFTSLLFAFLYWIYLKRAEKRKML